MAFCVCSAEHWCLVFDYLLLPHSLDRMKLETKFVAAEQSEPYELTKLWSDVRELSYGRLKSSHFQTDSALGCVFTYEGKLFVPHCGDCMFCSLLIMATCTVSVSVYCRLPPGYRYIYSNGTAYWFIVNCTDQTTKLAKYSGEAKSVHSSRYLG